MAKPPSARQGRDLTTGPIASTLLIFALPVLGSNVLQSLNGSINAVFVGRFLGETALAATSNANLILFLLLGAVFGLGLAATILVAQSFGARDIAQAKRVVGTSAAFFVLLSAALATLGFIYVDEILLLLGTPADALPLARDYLRIIFIAVPPMNLLSFVMTILRGAGDSRTPFAFMALAVALDIVLNPFLITGLGPFPAMGIAGSAMSTLIGQSISALAILVLLYRRRHPLALRGNDLGLLRPDFRLLRIIVMKGIPMGLQMIVISVSALMLMGLVNTFGSQTAAAYGVAAQLWTYVQMPALAIGAAVSSMAAQNVGAGKWDRVSRITRSGVVYSLVMTGALILLLTLLDKPALALFLGSDSEALPIARHIHLVATWGFLFFGVSLVLFGTVRANGQVVWPLIILFVSMYPVRLGFALGTYDWLGSDALWLSFPIGMLATCIMAVALYLHGGWRRSRMEVAETPHHEECIEHAEASKEPGGALSPAG